MAINVVLELLTGPQRGRKARLGANQMLTVGRTQQSDFAAPGDPKLSGQHFTLKTDRFGCSLVDLNSVNGTFVNDQKVVSTVLSDGSRIIAGETVFLVHITGDGGSGIVSPATIRAPAAPMAPIAPSSMPRSNAPATATFVRETCTSGLLLYQGKTTDMPAIEVARRLTAHFPLWLIVDFPRLELSLPPELKKPEHLFNWFPESVAVKSPIVCGSDELADAFAVIEACWGKAGISCLFSGIDKPALLAHLRQIARWSDDSILGYCWPSVLVMILAYCRPEFVQRIMNGINAIFVEAPEQPEVWRLFTLHPLDDLLRQLGIVSDGNPPPKPGVAPAAPTRVA